jgi:hypothetical protein
MAVLCCVNGLGYILAETGKRSRSRAQIMAAPIPRGLPFLEQGADDGDDGGHEESGGHAADEGGVG